LRDFDNNNADVIHRYNADEVRNLQKRGILPDASVIGAFKDDEGELEDDVFVFEDI
jgi:hypothetical protein